MPEDFATLRTVAGVVCQEVDWAISVEQLLERGNARPLSRFDNTEAGYAIVRQRTVLVRDLALTLMRLYDDGRDTHSLPRAMTLLHRDEVRATLVAVEGARLEAGGRAAVADQLRALDEMWAAARRPRQGAINRLREIRDRYLAHNLPPPEQPATFEELFGLLEATIPVAGEIGYLTNVNLTRFNGVAEIWARRADGFFDALLAGAPAER